MIDLVSSGRDGHGHFPGKSCVNSKKAPMVSIITVVLNGAHCLEKSMKSVEALSYDNIEYIVIDGASSDGTMDIIRKNESFVDYWVSEPDRGVYDAMNKAIRASHGDYILFLGADDYLYDVIHEVVNEFDDEMMSYYGNVILSGNEKRYGGRFYPLKLFLKNIPHQAIFYSRYVFDDYKYECKYSALADYALNLKVFSDEKYGLSYIPRTVAYYNNENGLSSVVIDHKFAMDKPGVIKKHYSRFYYIVYMLIRLVFKGRR